MENLESKGMELALKGGNYSPVHVTNNDTVGAALLGAIAVLLLIAFLRSRSGKRAFAKALPENV